MLRAPHLSVFLFAGGFSMKHLRPQPLISLTDLFPTLGLSPAQLFSGRPERPWDVPVHTSCWRPFRWPCTRHICRGDEPKTTTSGNGMPPKDVTGCTRGAGWLSFWLLVSNQAVVIGSGDGAPRPLCAGQSLLETLSPAPPAHALSKIISLKSSSRCCQRRGQQGAGTHYPRYPRTSAQSADCLYQGFALSGFGLLSGSLALSPKNFL